MSAVGVVMEAERSLPGALLRHSGAMRFASLLDSCPISLGVARN